MTETRASYFAAAEGERVTAIEPDGAALKVTTQLGSRRVTYHGVQRCDVEVGDVLDEPLQHRWRTVSQAWSPFDGSADDD